MADEVVDREPVGVAEAPIPFPIAALTLVACGRTAALGHVPFMVYGAKGLADA